MPAPEGHVPDQVGGDGSAMKRAVARIMRVELRRRRGLRLLGWIVLAIFAVALLNAPPPGQTTAQDGSPILAGIIAVLLGLNGLIGVAVLFRYRVLPMPRHRWRRAMRILVHPRRAWRAATTNQHASEPEESDDGRD
jgi:hypothetical protein